MTFVHLGNRLADSGFRLEHDMLELRDVVGQPTVFDQLMSGAGRGMQWLGNKLVELAIRGHGSDDQKVV